MKKLLLSSDTPFIIEKGFVLLGIPKEKIKIAYVITASKTASNPRFFELFEKRMGAEGYNFEEVDIEGKDEKTLYEIFKNKNIIFVEGGNTFYLLKHARASGFDKVVKKLIEKGVVYIGASAGSHLACPTIETSTWGPKDKDHFGVTDLTGLNLVPFLIKSHYTDSLEKLFADKIKQAKYYVQLLRDGQAILVEGNSYRLVE